ncbi:unnamed protein product, partial [Closterium sp. NIES-65]
LNGLHLQRPSWEAELQPLEGVTGMVEVVVFDMRVRHMIGYRWRNSSSTDTTPFAHTDSGVEGNEEGSGPLFFCCTKELEPLTGCTVGRLIVRRAAHEPDWPQVLEAQFIGNSSLTATLDAEVHVPRAGFVYVWLAMCDKNLDNTKVFGHTEWRAHGWGYLPGMLSAHLPIQTVMLVLYTFLYLAWRPQFGPAWHSLDRNSLPHFLTFLLLLSLLSTLTTLCDLLLLCTTGHRFVLVTLAAVTVGVLQGLLLRGVLVGVAVGVGTLLPKVGVIPGKVGLMVWKLVQSGAPAEVRGVLVWVAVGVGMPLPKVGVIPGKVGRMGCNAVRSGGARWRLLVGVAVGVGTLLPKALIPAALYVLVAATCEAVRTVGQVDDWGSGEHVALCSPLVLLDLCLAAWLIPAALTTKAQASDSRLLSTFRQALSAMGGISAAALALTCWEHHCTLSTAFPISLTCLPYLPYLPSLSPLLAFLISLTCLPYLPYLPSLYPLLAFLISLTCLPYLPYLPSLSPLLAFLISLTCLPYLPYLPSLSPLLAFLISLTCLPYLPYLPSLSPLRAFLISLTCLPYLPYVPSLSLLLAFLISLTCLPYLPYVPSLSLLLAFLISLTCLPFLLFFLSYAPPSPASPHHQAYVKLSDPLNLQWQSDWLITAAWHLLSFLALASLCFLWSPALLSLRLASPEST